MAKNLLVNATITQAESTAAVEAARAFCCLVHSGCIRIGLDGNVMEDWDDRMKDHTEDRHKRKRDAENHDIDADIANSISLSLPADILVSLRATNEMASARHYKLVARPMWPPQAAPSQPCPSCGETLVLSTTDSRGTAVRRTILRVDDEEACHGV